MGLWEGNGLARNTHSQSWVRGKWRAGIGWGVSASWVGLWRSASKDWSWISTVLERDDKWERRNEGRGEIASLCQCSHMVTQGEEAGHWRRLLFSTLLFPCCSSLSCERCEHALPGQRWLVGAKIADPARTNSFTWVRKQARPRCCLDQLILYVKLYVTCISCLGCI